MSDDLISRKAVKASIEAIRECWAISPYVSADDIRLYSNVFNVISRFISDCPTAFDKEKVIEQIKVLSTGIILNINICDDYAEGYVRAAKDAIEIVEKGGIE